MHGRATREDLNRLFVLLLKFEDFRKRFLVNNMKVMRDVAWEVDIRLSDEQLKLFMGKNAQVFRNFATLRNEFVKTGKHITIIASPLHSH